MRIHHVLPLCAVVTAASFLVVGCADGRGDGGGPGEKSASPRSSESSSESSAASPTPSGDDRTWEPDDALRRADRALDAYADDGTDAELVDSGTAYVGSGLDKTFKAPGDRAYRLDITCDTAGVDELTLTLSRDGAEQAYGVGCGDREADQFNIPPGTPFKARVDPVKDGTGLISWRLNSIAPGDVDGCDDDIDGCED
ncbi:hypothetical protein [Streptomyces sp. NPDC021622]|uniref:hypothetical protein n=1 Tax=Streptomyces sp. NPDC021622 TaxID=3155013 RepID=UPI0033DCFAB8